MSERTGSPLLQACLVLVIAMVLAPALRGATAEVNRLIASVWPAAMHAPAHPLPARPAP